MLNGRIGSRDRGLLEEARRPAGFRGLMLAAALLFLAGPAYSATEREGLVGLDGRIYTFQMPAGLCEVDLRRPGVQRLRGLSFP